MEDAYFGVALERMRVQESMKNVNKRKWRKSTKKYKRNMKQNQVRFLCFIFKHAFFFLISDMLFLGITLTSLLFRLEIKTFKIEQIYEEHKNHSKW